MASEGKTRIAEGLKLTRGNEENKARGAMGGRPAGGRADDRGDWVGDSGRESIYSIHAAPQSKSRQTFADQ